MSDETNEGYEAALAAKSAEVERLTTVLDLTRKDFDNLCEVIDGVAKITGRDWQIPSQIIGDVSTLREERDAANAFRDKAVTEFGREEKRREQAEGERDGLQNLMNGVTEQLVTERDAAIARAEQAEAALEKINGVLEIYIAGESSAGEALSEIKAAIAAKKD